MLPTVKEWLLFHPPWGQKEDVISFIMDPGSEKKGIKTLLNKLQCQNILYISVLQFFSYYKTHSFLDKISTNIFFAKCIAF